jgi:sulfur carrier protein ThiS
MKITFINNDGGGWSKTLTINHEATVENIIVSQIGEGFDPNNYKIRVNREPVMKDYILKDGDRVTCTPVKVDGA